MNNPAMLGALGAAGANRGAPWSDGTLWDDGTGWTDGGPQQFMMQGAGADAAQNRAASLSGRASRLRSDLAGFSARSRTR